MNGSKISRDSLVQLLNHSYSEKVSFDADSYFFQLFQYQYHANPVYRRYCDILSVNPLSVGDMTNIPLLPVTAFKFHIVKSDVWNESLIFKSSGTTRSNRAQHFVRDKSLYLKNTEHIWQTHFGALDQFVFFSLLPGYVDRGDSSLIYMVDYFINRTIDNGSMFVHGKENMLETLIKKATDTGKKPVIFGVSYALVSFLEKYSWNIPDVYIIETGGMKGLREDMTKEELFDMLTKGFTTPFVFSEYGMTELFSQAYTDGGLGFSSSPQLKLIIRQLQDPLSIEENGKQGMVGCLDAANIDSCAFILTEDTGFINEEHQMFLTGRLDHSDIRGCNLLML